MSAPGAGRGLSPDEQRVLPWSPVLTPEGQAYQRAKEKAEGEAIAAAIEGRVRSPLLCPLCLQPVVYVARWDSHACFDCNRWDEAACECPPEDECGFQGRPATPKEAVT